MDAPLDSEVIEASITSPARPGLLAFRSRLSDRVGEPVLQGLSLACGLGAIGRIVWIAETVFSQTGHLALRRRVHRPDGVEPQRRRPGRVWRARLHLRDAGHLASLAAAGDA